MYDYFNSLRNMIKMMQHVSLKFKPGLPCLKQLSQADSFHQQIRLKLKEETSKMLHLVLQTGLVGT